MTKKKLNKFTTARAPAGDLETMKPDDQGFAI